MAEEWPGRLPDHVTTPLLTRITAESMDEDYRLVAQRRTSTGTPSGPGRPHWTAAGVVVLFGVLVTLAAVQTSRNADTTDAGRATLIARVESGREDLARQQDQIAGLQETNIALDDQRAEATAAQAEADAQVRRLETITGFVAVSGPGVSIVVDDAPEGDVTQLVRDEDLALLVDGLWAAGAEAIAINNQRLTALSAIDNEGPAVKVNSRPVTPPYTVRAIGDVLTLQGNLLNTDHGQQFFDLAEDLGFVYDMDDEDELTLPSARPPRLRHVTAGTSADKPNIQDEEEATP